MDATGFRHHLAELQPLAAGPLRDADLLAAVVISAASAMGLPTDAPPVARSGPKGVVIALVCRDGHVVVHTDPDRHLCLVDVVTRLPLPIHRATDVIARRLGVEPQPTA